MNPCLTDPAIRRDVARFAKQVDPKDLDAASNRLNGFGGPALLVWGAGDRFFKLEFARRLRDAFADASLVEIEKGRTFVPHDEPARLAQEIVRLPGRVAAGPMRVSVDHPSAAATTVRRSSTIAVYGSRPMALRASSRLRCS